MPTLYVTEPGSVVRRAGGSIVVTLDEVQGEGAAQIERRRRLIKVEPHRLELISLVGRAHITADATHLCLEQGIAVAWFRANGHFVGKIVPELSRTADLRLAQFRMAEDESQALPLARIFVSREGPQCRRHAGGSALKPSRPAASGNDHRRTQVDR